MKLSQFTDLLHDHPEKPFRLVLPGAATVPASFHITEVGHVTNHFIDCGGRLHRVQLPGERSVPPADAADDGASAGGGERLRSRKRLRLTP